MLFVSVVAIFLAVDLPKAGLQNVHWFIWLIVAFVIFHVFSHLILQIHGFSVDKRGLLFLGKRIAVLQLFFYHEYSVVIHYVWLKYQYAKYDIFR